METCGTGRVGAVVVVALAFGAFSPAAPAQNDSAAAQPAPTDAEWRQQMDARMRQLERENEELRKTVGQVSDTQQAVMRDAESRGWLAFDAGEPRRTTPDFFDVNTYASQGAFPGSFLIPGTRTSLQVGGYVQLDAIFDSDRIDNDDAFVVNAIPTGGEKTGAGNSNFNIRQTRLFLKTETPTQNWGNLVTYIEIDFQGTDGAEPRIRHAYGQIGEKYQFLAGQTWSAFQDATVFPAALDAQGPPGIINSRRPQVRFRQDWT